MMLGQATPQVFSGGGDFMASNNAAWSLAIAALVALAMFLVIWLRSRKERWKHAGTATADEDVFQRLCAANDLSPHQVYLLREMYFDLGLENPVALFVCPQVYDDYLRLLEGNAVEMLNDIRLKLFFAPADKRLTRAVTPEAAPEATPAEISASSSTG